MLSCAPLWNSYIFLFPWISLRQFRIEQLVGFVLFGIGIAWSKSSSTCLGELKWPSLAWHWTYSTDYLYSILHHKNLFKDYFKLKPNFSSTRSHQLTIQRISSSINAFRYSFFVNLIFLWNHIPLDILSIVCKHIFHCKLHSYLW